MKQILILFFSLLILCINAQVCFTYDNAGNRIKRQTCVMSINTQENEQLSEDVQKLTSEMINSSDDFDLSKIVLYPNPTSAAIQLKEQQEWYGSTLKVMSYDGKVVHTITITDGPIDMSHLPSGSYFLILSNDTLRKTAKLFITK